MPLYLNDEQTMLRDTAKDFVAEHAPVSHMRSLRDANDATGFSRDLWKQFAEMGFTGILIGEEQGGLGLGHVERSEEHTSELQSLMRISYAVFCLKKKKQTVTEAYTDPWQYKRQKTRQP